MGRDCQVRDDLTAVEVKWFEENPTLLPWNNIPIIGATEDLSFQAGRGKRKSIAPNTLEHWTAVLLEDKKKDDLERKTNEGIKKKKKKEEERKKNQNKERKISQNKDDKDTKKK